jgi:hypothetical protein
MEWVFGTGKIDDVVIFLGEERWIYYRDVSKFGEGLNREVGNGIAQKRG